MVEELREGFGLAEEVGDRQRCPRAVEGMWMIRDLGGLGQRSLSPTSSASLCA